MDGRFMAIKGSRLKYTGINVDVRDAKNLKKIFHSQGLFIDQPLLLL